MGAWLVLGVVATFSGDSEGGIGILVLLVLLGLPLLYANERASVHVLPGGIRVVPYVGRSHTYGWDQIERFYVGSTRYSGRYSGVLVYAALRSTDGEPATVPLTATNRGLLLKRSPQRVCDELNAALAQAR